MTYHYAVKERDKDGYHWGLYGPFKTNEAAEIFLAKLSAKRRAEPGRCGLNTFEISVLEDPKSAFDE